eukprot:658423-Ditylum_brightwellii.AAC.1
MDNPLDTAQRNLVPNNPACRDKYVNLLSKLFKEHKIYGKVADVNNKVLTGAISAADATDIYERSDSQITQFMLGAEKQCRKGET